MSTDAVPHDPISQAAEALRQAEAELVDQVRSARRRGITWAQVGESLGVSRQAAFKRFGHAVDADTGEDLTTEPIDVATLAADAYCAISMSEHHTLHAKMTVATARSLNHRRLADMWRDVTALVGPWEDVAETVVRTPGGTVVESSTVHPPCVVRQTMKHERGEMVQQVSFNRNGRINGMQVVTADEQERLSA